MNESGYDCADYDCDDYDCADEIVSDGGRHDDICGDNYENGGCRDGGFPLRRLLRMTKQRPTVADKRERPLNENETTT